MNIAILIPELGGGGAERASVLLGDYYFEKGHKVYYFLANTNIRKKYFPKGKIITTQISIDYSYEVTNLGLLWKLIVDSFEIRKLKREYKIDIAVSFMEAFNYLNILSYRGEKNVASVRTILSERTDIDDILYRKWLVRSMYNRSQCVVAVSKYAKEDLVNNYHVNEKRIRVIPNAVSNNICTDKRKKEWVWGKNVIISIGRLDRIKQQERMIRAFSYVVQRNEDAILLLLGEGPQRSYLQDLARSLNLASKVCFLGFQTDIAYYLKNSKIFVMTSKTEGFPNGMIEAMSYGLPVVTMNSPGGIAEIIGKRDRLELKSIYYGKYGIVTPYITGSIQAEKIEREEILFGKAIVQLINNDELYKRYKKQSLKRASMYSRDNVMKRWDKLFLEDE